jgi:hypothetical protein
MLILGEWHLRGVLTEYVRHYNSHRPHQALQQEPPLCEPGHAVDITTRIERRQVLGPGQRIPRGSLASVKRQVSAYAGVLARHRVAKGAVAGQAPADGGRRHAWAGC